MPDLGLTYQDVVSYAGLMMGSPRVTLHLTDGQYRAAINQVVDKYSRLKPRIKYASLTAQPGVQNYTPEAGKIGYGILTVGVPRIDPIAPLLLSSGPRLDIFGYRYSYPYRDIAELEWDYAYFDMATRILSSEFDWEWMDGQIWVYPSPSDTYMFAYAYAEKKILGDESSETPGTIPMVDHDLIKDGILAQVKMIEGAILSRFDGVPGAQLAIKTNGPSLVKEGREEWDAWQKSLMLRVPPMAPVKSGQGGARLMTSN